MAREASIKRRTLEELNRITGVVARKRHGSEFETAGDPDILGCIQVYVICPHCKRSVASVGQHFEIELKQVGKKATKLQERRLKEWEDTGAKTCVAHSVEEALRFVVGIRR